MRKLYYTVVIFLPLLILYACFHEKYMEKKAHPPQGKITAQQKEIAPHEKPLAMKKMEEEKPSQEKQFKPEKNPDEEIDCMAYEKANASERPEIKNGTFYLEGRPTFLVGPWLNEFYSEENEPMPIDGYRDDPAYNRYFDYEIAMQKGFSTCHPPIITWFTCKKLAPDCPRLLSPSLIKRKDSFLAAVKGFKNLPLVVDHAHIGGWDTLAERFGRNLYPFPDEAYQQMPVGRWHEFVPYCPEDPVGMKIYRTYWQDSASILLKNGANPWIYELFNEPAYDCRCKYNKENFINVLKEKYGSLDNVNKRWGSNFKSFEEIAGDTNFGRQKGLWVDWLKFIEDRWCDVLNEGMKTIREMDTREKVYFSSQCNTGVPFLMTEVGYDEYKNARVLDIVNTEGRITLSLGKEIKSENPMERHTNARVRMQLDICRAAAEGKPVIDTEEDLLRLDENGNCRPQKRSDFPLLLWNEAIHGASSIQIYCWAKRFDHWPTRDLAGAKEAVSGPNSRWLMPSLLNPYAFPRETLEGIKDFNREMEKLAEIVLPVPRIKGEIALLLSNPSRRFTGSIEKEFTTYYDALASSHYPFDVIFEEQINKGWAKKYKAIISPYCNYTYDETSGNLRKYAEDGGVVILQGMDLCFDEYGKEVSNNKLLGLASRSPINMPIPDEITLTVPMEGGYPDKIESKLSIKVAVDGAEVLSKSKKNIPQITRNKTGKGKIYYNACKTDGPALTSILTTLLKDAGIKQPFTLRSARNELLPKVDAQVIDRGDTKLYYFVNWTRMSELGMVKLCNLSSRRFSFSQKYYLSDPVTKALYLSPSGKEAWTESELKKGAKVFLPAEERVLMLLSENKPAGLKSSLSSEDVEKEYKTRRAVDEKEEKALEERKAKVKEAYSQRNKFLNAVKENCFPVDISKYCNMGFEDDVAGDGKGGGFDHGANNDLREFPVGKQEFCNVPFSIINPAENNGKSIIVMRGHDQNYFPLEVKGIPIGRKVRNLYFLHTVAWDGGQYAYIVNYDDGSTAEIAIRAGKEIGDWWEVSEDKAPLAKVAWTGKNRMSNIGAYCYRWENPWKDKVVKNIDLKSCNAGMIPAIIAITGEE